MTLKTITAIVETPKGSNQKFDFDPLLGCFKLNKLMPAGLFFPYDFGYIPGTTGGDGDPLDVLIISEMGTFTGCAVDCRVISAIKADQKERDGERMRNDRIITVASVSSQFASVQTLSDLPKGLLNEVENFFDNYNKQAGKVFSPLERLSPAKTMTLIKQAQDEAMKDTLVQLLVPITDQHGKPFPGKLFTDLDKELKAHFGGFTAYSRSPVQGAWKNEKGNNEHDQLIVYEVLLHSSEVGYWTQLKTKLERSFKQHEIQILFTKVHKVH